MESNILGYVIFAVVAAVLLRPVYIGFIQGKDEHEGRKHCMTCGIDAVPAEENKGNGLIEIILWICFILPGLIYSIWRRTNVVEICPSCGARPMVPFASPSAINHRKTLELSR
jgi:hypothetical protein